MYEEYKQKRQELQKFMDKDDYSKASEIAMEMCEEFPEHCSTYYNLAYVQAMLEQLEDVITTLDTAYDRGAWWLENDFEEFPHYEKLLSSSRFQNIIRKFNKRYKDAMMNSQLKWAVRIPPDYDPSSTYPLLIALPYRDSNIEHFEPFWKNKVLSNGVVLATLQSFGRIWT
ncbi:MAG: hypothetical protein ACXAEJ_14255 [Candidatus Thorarchaeota archaeon]|jgi:hypothetical protein